MIEGYCRCDHPGCPACDPTPRGDLEGSVRYALELAAASRSAKVSEAAKAVLDDFEELLSRLTG